MVNRIASKFGPGCIAVAFVAACGSSSSNNKGADDDGGTGSTSGGASSSGGETSSSSGSSTAGTTTSGSGTSSSGTTTSSGSGGTSSGGNPEGGSTSFNPGNPGPSCSTGVPTRGQLVDTSTAATVVGSGTASSCTFSVLSAAVAKGGIVTFNCGSAPVTIAVTATLKPPITKNTVIDGGGLITLDGQGSTQILSYNGGGWQMNAYVVTLQRITLTGGKTTPTDAIPAHPANPDCSTGYDDGEGGAVFMDDGSLTVIDSIFDGNQAAPLGPDTGGGAIYVEGSKSGVLIVHSTFTNNKGSNGGAVGTLWAELDVYNSVLSGNTATGMNANDANCTECPFMNNGQCEVGSGGNGGALYNDGENANIIVCGDSITGNAAGTGGFGGGVFFTSDNYSGTLTFTDTTMTGNTGGSWTNVMSGTVKNAGTAVGTNALSITITDSTLQGVP